MVSVRQPQSASKKSSPFAFGSENLRFSRSLTKLIELAVPMAVDDHMAWSMLTLGVVLQRAVIVCCILKKLTTMRES